MTLEEVKKWIAVVESTYDECTEDGHIVEDKLAQDFIAFVADPGMVPTHELTQCAAAIADMLDTKRTRWYA